MIPISWAVIGCALVIVLFCTVFVLVVTAGNADRVAERIAADASPPPPAPPERKPSPLDWLGPKACDCATARGESCGQCAASLDSRN